MINRSKSYVVTAALLLASLSCGVGAETGTGPETPTAFVHATVAIGDGGAPIEDGTVIISKGRVITAGRNVVIPAGAKRIDARGKWVTPGIISAFSSLGLGEIDSVAGSNDRVARDAAFSASIDIAPAVNPAAMAIGFARAQGLTRALVAPHSGKKPFGGEGAVIDLSGQPNSITRARALQTVELGQRGAALAGGSRASMMTWLSLALDAADAAGKGPSASPVPRGGLDLQEADIQALVPVVQGTEPLFATVWRASDIRALLALESRFPKLNLVLVGATEAWLAAEDIARAKARVILLGTPDIPLSVEELGANESNFGRLHAAGVAVAQTITELPDRGPERMRQKAGNLVALKKIPGAVGVDWGTAFAAITSQPAAMAGLSGELGSLLPGRRADVVVWDGDPLEQRTLALRVWIDGVEQSLVNRPQLLMDRYNSSAAAGVVR